MSIRHCLTLLFAVLLVVSCGSTDNIGPEPATADTSPSTTPTALSTPTTVAADIGAVHADTTLLQGTYGFVSIEISDATLANIEPRSFKTDTPVASEDRYLFLTMEIDNTSRQYTANWVPSPYGLRVSGEPGPLPEIVSGRPNVGLTPGQTTDVLVAYPVDGSTQFADLEFAFAAEGTIPLVIPLTGAQEPWPWPIDISVEAEADLGGEGISCGQSLTVEITEGGASIDLLDTEGWFQGSRRALMDERFLTIGGRVTNHGGQRCGGGATNVTGDSVRLYVDGVPRPPVGFVNVTVPRDAAEDFQWHFAYPIDATELEFVFGDLEGAHLSVPIDVSEVP